MLMKNKETNNTIVPKLRVPEFRDKGEWEEKSLGECAVSPLDYGMNAAAIDYDGENKYIST